MRYTKYGDDEWGLNEASCK